MPTEQLQPVRRALLSVSDKTGLVEFAQALADGGVAILSTGGTAKLLKERGINVTDVQDHTGFPEIMGGRVKTLHPKIHGGILGREEVDQDAMQEHGIEPIDLVVINLYPFEQTIQKADCTLEQAIENIDIGGPAMLRAAAKNHARVSVVVDPNDYSSVLEHLQQNNMSTQANIRLQLANKAFAHTSHYDSAITTYLSQHTDEDKAFPQELRLSYAQKQSLRYGENPHQSAAFYTRAQVPSGTVSSAKVLQGKELSFNNIADTDAALECVKQFDQTACVIVKHANPCGVGVAETLNDAYQLAYSTDPTSAFGGIIAFNKPLDAQTTQAILDQQFVEVIIAPEIEADAIEVLKTKPNIRALTCGAFENESRPLDLKHVQGGLLLQDSDTAIVQAEQLKVVTKRVPTEEETRDLIFAWRVAKFVKSNAIVYARDQRTIGVGAGQMSRVYSAKIAGIKAQDENLQVAGSVMASDAFFPFRDGLDAANEAGIKAVIQPGGSMKDDEVIAAADEHGMAMVFTGIRHFRH